MQLSTTVGADADAWQAEPPSDRDSVKVVRTGLDRGDPRNFRLRPFHSFDNSYFQRQHVVTCLQSVNIPATRQKDRQQAKVERNLGRGRRDGKSSTKSEVPASKRSVKNRRGSSGKGIHERATRAAQSYDRGRSACVSAVTARIIADRERARYQQQQVCPPTHL